MRKVVSLFGGLVLAATAVPVAAATIVVDPDAVAPGTNISSHFAGVTLAASPNGFGTGSDVFAIDSASQPNEPFNASTGRLVFGTNSATFPHLFREPGFSALRVTFAAGVFAVSIDAIANDGADTGFLQAYDIANNLLGTYTTASLGLNQFETMTFASASGDIAYIIASGLDSGSSLGLDHLTYDNGVTGVVPEPATWAMLVLGFGMLGGAIRYRKRAVLSLA